MRRRTYTFTVVGDQCSRFGGGLWHGFYVRHILLTGIHTSHRYTYFSQVYILLTGIHTSHRYTYFSQVYILLTGIHTSHRYTYFSQVYILLTGIHTSHRYTYRNESSSSWKIFYVFNNEVQA